MGANYLGQFVINSFHLHYYEFTFIHYFIIANCFKY